MNVSKSSSDAEHWRDSGKSLVDIPNIFGLSVQAVVVNSGIVNTVLFSSGDTNLHLEPEIDLGHTAKVLGADLDVFFFALLGEIKHVRAAAGGVSTKYCLRTEGGLRPSDCGVAIATRSRPHTQVTHEKRGSPCSL